MDLPCDTHSPLKHSTNMLIVDEISYVNLPQLIAEGETQPAGEPHQVFTSYAARYGRKQPTPLDKLPYQPGIALAFADMMQLDGALRPEGMSPEMLMHNPATDQ